MLKLTYTEDSFHLEYIEESLETWLSTRVTLAVRSAISINIQPTTAAFPVPANLDLIQDLEVQHSEVQNLETTNPKSSSKNLRNSHKNNIELSYCDIDTMEVTLRGSWVTSDRDSETGVFVTALETSSELLLQEIYQYQNLCQV